MCRFFYLLVTLWLTIHYVHTLGHPQWGWFSVALFFNYGDSFGAFIENRKIRFVPPAVVHYLRYHTWISFTMYAVLFVMSVLSLKKGTEAMEGGVWRLERGPAVPY